MVVCWRWSLGSLLASACVHGAILSPPPKTRSRASAGDALLPHPGGAALHGLGAPLEGQGCVPRRGRGVHRDGALLQRRGRQGQVRRERHERETRETREERDGHEDLRFYVCVCVCVGVPAHSVLFSVILAGGVR